MTEKSQQLFFDSIILDLKANTMKQAFQLIAEHVSQMIGSSPKIIFDHLMDQERDEGTSVGNGISMPHMKLSRLTKPMTILAKLNDTINGETLDNMPIDQICIILSPDYDGVKHLQRLAITSRHFKNNRLCSDIRDAKTSQEIRNLIKLENQRRMAA